jgi:hypothetical protein
MNKSTSIQEAGRIAASANGPSVDVSSFDGRALLILNAAATEGADHTLDVKLQHSDDGTAWEDFPGLAFDQVTNANPLFQVLEFEASGLKKYARAVSTLAGTTPAATRSVSLVGRTKP